MAVGLQSYCVGAEDDYSQLAQLLVECRRNRDYSAGKRELRRNGSQQRQPKSKK